MGRDQHGGADYVKFMRALGDETRIHRRLAIELLARTGMRVGELCDLEADAVQRWIDSIAKRAGIGHVHPHRLRQTLATQAINRGMSSKRSQHSSAADRST